MRSFLPYAPLAEWNVLAIDQTHTAERKDFKSLLPCLVTGNKRWNVPPYEMTTVAF